MRPLLILLLALAGCGSKPEQRYWEQDTHTEVIQYQNGRGDNIAGDKIVTGSDTVIYTEGHDNVAGKTIHIIH